MWFTSLFKKSRKLREFAGLYDVAGFRQAMLRERARADRWEQTLTLLSFGAPRTPSGLATLKQVGGLLRRRMRITDEAGWLDRRHIGVLLPNTPPWGAWTLADEICLAFPDRIPLPQCRVYCYPSDWFTSDTAAYGAAAEVSLDSDRTEALEPLFFKPLPPWKRALDLVGAGMALLAVLPLMVLTAVLIKLFSRGPIFFRQARVGFGGRYFTMYKFRTMVVDAERLKDHLHHRNEQDGPAFKIKDDPRITSFGRFLRRSSIDEFPQLWNVLKGDMSLVGPRPPIPDEVGQYDVWQRRRLEITPGLTCIWQVRGRSRVSFCDWMRMDIQYMGQRSPWCDVKLLAGTVPAIVTGRGAC